MEAQGCSEMCVLEAMDLLWFDQIILFPQNLISPTPKTPSQSPNFSLKKSFSKISSPTTSLHELDSSSEESDDDNKEIRRMGLNHHIRCHSFSPTSAKKESRKLEKTMSLGDLELEEVKGFMDLGFIFKKENLSRRMMRLVPGLKRLINTKYQINDQDSHDDDEIIMRPYLSEAWVVKKPDNYSPLMNVRIGDCCASDMKKVLKCWARNVALAVQQEC